MRGRSPTTRVARSMQVRPHGTAMVASTQEANLDRLSALIDAAASRADDRVALFDFVLAIGDLWDRLGLRDPFVDAQLSDADSRAQLARAARDGESEGERD